MGRDYERISGRNGLLSTIKRRPVTLSWDSNQKTFVFNEEAAKNWTANPGPYQDREVGRAYQSLNMAAAHVASLGMLSGGSVVTGALMGGATSASGTALNGGSQREVLAASTGGALAGGLSALSGGGFTREFQLNTAFTALGLVVEDLINGNEIDPMKVALKSVVGGTLSAGGSWAGKQVDQEGLSQLLESGLAGGGLAEVTDPVSDGLVDMAREALGTADARTDVTPPENLMCEPEPPISLEP